MNNLRSLFKRKAQLGTGLLLAFGLLLGTAGLSLRPAQAQTTNLALNRPVVCSSTEGNFTCANAVDGNLNTRWSSAFSDPQWIQVDLGATYNLTSVILRWEAAYGRSFQIQASSNGSTWTSLYSTTTGSGGVQTIPVSGSGRYVRMNGTARATAYGYSLWEFEVYGTSGVTTPTRTITLTPNSTLPDLTITSVTYVGSTPACANNPRDNVVVSNIGGVSAGSFVVSFGPSYTQTVSGLAAGASVTLSFPAIMGTSTATADSTNVIAEGNESNNSMSASLPAPTQAPTCTPTRTATITQTPSFTPSPTGGGTLADLVISSVITAPDGWTGGCALNLIMGVRVTVRNAGMSPAGAFVMDVSGTQQTISAGLAAGASTSLWFARTGSLLITADATGLVAESNEGNNTLSYVSVTATPPALCTRTPTVTATMPPGCGTVVVVTSTPSPTFTPTPRTATATTTPSCGGPIYITATPTFTPTFTPPSGSLPDLTVLSITEFTYTVPTLTPNAQGCWQSIRTSEIGLRVTIQNIGTGNAGSFVVNLSLNATNYTKTVSGLAAGQTLAVDFAPVPMPSTRTATVDITGLVTESNENNNTLTFNIFPLPTATRTGTPLPIICLTATPTRTPTPAISTNLALNKPVVCSSTENAGTVCANAVDGNLSTRWASAFSDPQWIRVDLGASYSLSSVVLRWEAAYARAFQIQVSNDTTTWTSLYSTTTGTGGVQTINIIGSGRYIRMYGTGRATGYGYSLWEFEVYGSTPVQNAVSGSVVVAGGACCVGGTAGSIININVAFSATSSAATVTQMRVSTNGGGCATESALSQVAWEPFAATKTFPFGPIAINWTSLYVTAQYRDAAGNLSPVYCDNISVEGMPATPTTTAIP